MKRSTGLRNSMLATGSFKAALTGTVINIYSAATEPATADTVLPDDAVLLLTYSLEGEGGGVSFEASATGGILQKNAEEIWQGTIVSSGTPKFFRMQLPSDGNTESTTLSRLQGNIGLVDADLVVSSLTWTAGDQRKLNYFVASIAAG